MFIRRILTVFLFVMILEICSASNVAQIIFDAGMEKYAKGDYEAAADYLCQASDMMPENIEAGFYGTLALVYSGRSKLALEFLEKQHSSFRGTEKYNLFHKKLSEFIEENNKLQARHLGTDFESYNVVDPLKKEAWMQPRDVKNKKVPEVNFIQKMQNLIDSEKYDEAVSALKQHVSKTHKHCGESYRLLGLIAFNSFEFQDAVNYFKKAIRYGSDRFDVNFMSGQSYFSMNEKTNALKSFQKALKLNPKDVFTRLRIADIFCRDGRYSEANSVFREILKSNPEVTDAKSGLVYVYFEQGYIDMALQTADEILKQEPDNAKARFLKAKVLLSEKKYSEASVESELAFKNKPMDQEIEAFRALMLIREFKLQEGIEMLKSMLKENENNVYAMAALAEGLFVSDDKEEALKMLDSADKIKKISLSSFLRAQIAGLKHDISAAKRYFGEYVKLSGNSPRTNLEFADFLESINDNGGARRVYNDILIRYPGTPFAKKASERKDALKHSDRKETKSEYTGPKGVYDL